MKKSSIIVFLLTYGLFYVSSVLFPIDRTWYDALEKPSWTPSGMTINDMGCIIWTYCIISCNYLQQLWIQAKNILVYFPFKLYVQSSVQLLSI